MFNRFWNKEKSVPIFKEVVFPILSLDSEVGLIVVVLHL